jgi:hypothetical protein
VDGASYTFKKSDFLLGNRYHPAGNLMHFQLIMMTLRQLREAGVIIPVGKGRKAKWRNAQPKWGNK